MPVLLLVAGSRSLAAHPERLAWMHEQLAAFTQHLTPDDLFLSGASGVVDVAGAEAARATGATVEEFRLDGARWTDGVRTERRWADLIDPADVARAWPLKRDGAMVNAACRAAADPAWEVYVVGLIDPHSQTHGTAFTVERAASRGLRALGLKYPDFATDFPAFLPPAPPPPFSAGDKVVIDFETTGLSHRHAMPIEVGLIRVSPRLDRVLATYEARWHPEPGVLFDTEAQVFVGYPRRWRDAVPVGQALSGIAEMLREVPTLVAHNKGFDIPHLRAFFARMNSPLPLVQAKAICTMKLTRDYLVKPGHLRSATLEAAAGHLGVPYTAAHEAMPDAWACLGVLRELTRGMYAPDAAATPDETPEATDAP